ncbi:uncharacterized protein L969DRAFT_85261 [Mixia osmundae IAM 14324]|uniref:uncharacterized protein n=1 Tax=Mixia osmundae (strain CBS 9802 / IAM 14324 / JCM 22182 / KY 12970) TaxID=764103 RepID=UPI0004A54E9F|nr:uncharacterized protein L969DRAFT_85261 [Mixia osmundae IAM 14324]KEI41481.1 hypothetical protein L969DRAFT_85261 [Mixia osmundae IAM 14324]
MLRQPLASHNANLPDAPPQSPTGKLNGAPSPSKQLASSFSKRASPSSPAGNKSVPSLTISSDAFFVPLAPAPASIDAASHQQDEGLPGKIEKPLESPSKHLGFPGAFDPNAIKEAAPNSTPSTPALSLTLTAASLTPMTPKTQMTPIMRQGSIGASPVSYSPGPPSPFPWRTFQNSPKEVARGSVGLEPSRSLSRQGSTGSFRSGISTPRTPTGFEHLDFGADYFSAAFDDKPEEKRPPRSFDWEFWADPSNDVADFSFEGAAPILADEQQGTLASPLDTDSEAHKDSLNPLPTPPDSTAVSPIDSAPQIESSESTHRLQPDLLKRRLGPAEISYYLSSRCAPGREADGGVNDMYLHIGFRSTPRLVAQERILAIWTEMRLRHPLLASSVEFQDYEDIRFVYKHPADKATAFRRALRSTELRYNQPRDDMLDSYLNGVRTLHDDKLAALLITSPQAEPIESELDTEREYDYWLFATHFLGDGMALHTFSNEFFGMLGGGLETLEAENKLMWKQDQEELALPFLQAMPCAMESRLETPASWGRTAWAAARVEFNNSQKRLIGGQTLPREKRGARKTLVPTISYSPEDSAKIVKSCKAHGVSIAHAAFALVNIAHLRMQQRAEASAKPHNPALPTMLYSALNLRPQLAPLPKTGDETLDAIVPSYFSIAIGYYNVILPSFLPSDLTAEQVFWHRSKVTKEQTIKATKNKWLIPRSKLMSLERERRSIGWEQEDDRKRANKLAGLGFELVKPSKVVAANAASAAPKISKPAPSAPPSLALMGLSMLGPLDGMYKHATFPDVKLHTLTTGSRQRPGGMLLFAYTFAGRMWFSLGYDSTGFAEGVVEELWQGMQDGIQEFMLQ